MISLATIKGGSNAASYYAGEDNYYLAEADTQNKSYWVGKGAEKLGLLNQKVTQTELSQLLAGSLPHSITIGNDKKNHRAGYDICFHAPKSVSILALQDNNLEALVRDAVIKTLAVIEKECAQARLGWAANASSSKRNYEDTNNLTIALMKHSTSRELDPHLHYHAIVINATECSNKAWRALSSTRKDRGEGFSERIYEHQIRYGLIFRTELAKEVRKLGFNLEIVGPHALWEIKEVPKEIRLAMSKRRATIKDQMKELGKFTPKEADVITLDTRKSKSSNYNYELFKAAWKNELISLGFDPTNCLNTVNQNSLLANKKDHSVLDEAAVAVKDAVTHLSNYNLELRYNQLASQAMEFAIGKVTYADIVSAIKADNSLIALGSHSYTTKELLSRERKLKEFAKQEIKVHPLNTASIRSLEKIDDIKLKSLVSSIMNSSSRVSIVSINHDSHRELCSTILKVAEASGSSVRIVMPNSANALEANNYFKRDSKGFLWWLTNLGKPELGETIARFNLAYSKKLTLFNKREDLIIAGFAENLGSKELLDLLELTSKTGAKVIFLQNNNFRSALGRPLDTLKAGKTVIYALDKKPSEQTTDKLSDHNVKTTILEIKNQENRIKTTAKLYDDSTLVITDSKKEVTALNLAIREELGLSTKTTLSVPVNRSIGLTDVQKTLASQYKLEYHLDFFDRRGKGWQIKGIDKETNILWLNKGATSYRFNPKDYKKTNKFMVYEKVNLELAIGDRLIATANMPNLGIKNGLRVRVTDISDQHVSLLEANGKIIRLKNNLIEGSSFNYGYAATINNYLKKEVDQVVFSGISKALNQETVNELSAIAKQNLTIVSDDKTKLHRLGLNITLGELGTLASDQSPKRDVVDLALEHLSTREASFKYTTLLSTSLSHSVATEDKRVLDYEQVTKLIDQKIANGDVIRKSDNSLTTKYQVKLEQEILSNVSRHRGKLEPILALLSQPFPKAANDIKLTKGQLAACSLVTNSKDQFVVIQGYAGTGKTTVFKELKKILSDHHGNNFELIALAPTHQAVQELQKHGLEAKTLKSFLNNQIIPKSNQLFILDEASMVANQDFAKFTSMVANSQSRAILSGDIAQLQAVEAGKPFELIQKSGLVEQVILKEIIRQTDPTHKAAVIDILANRLETSLSKIPITEVEDHKKLIEQIVKDYCSRDAVTKANTLVIAHSNQDREAINLAIHNVEKAKKPELGVIRLTSKQLSNSEQKQSWLYNINDVVKLNGKYYTIISKQNEVLLLRDRQNGKDINFNPTKISKADMVNLYEPTQKNLSPGDLVKITETDRTRNLFANSQYRIQDIDRTNYTVTLNNELVLDMRKDQNHHWDYAYATTGYGAQGVSRKHIIDLANTKRRILTNQRSYYISASRATESMRIYTDNKQNLVKLLLTNKLDKTTALESKNLTQSPKSTLSKVKAIKELELS